MRTVHARLMAGLTVLLLVAILVLETPLALAAAFVVNDTRDRVDSRPGNGVCRTSSGTCTLRAAIQEANARSGADIIQLRAGTYVLTRAPLNDNDISTGDLDITAPLTINGAGAGVTILDGGTAPAGSPPERTALDRLFEIHPSAGNITIFGLTVRKGWEAKEGGAIYTRSSSAVRLVEVSVLNSSAGSSGGGIYYDGSQGGSLVVERSTISGHTTSGEGGGIYVASGSLTVTGTTEANSTIASNTARNGGGIYNAGTLNQAGQPSRVALTDTTVSGNTATSAGGGIYNSLEGALALTDVTVAANAAAGDGGGVASVSKSSLTVTRGTFSANTTGGDGGGVYTRTEGPLTISASAFSGNAARDALLGAGGGGGGLSVDGLGSVTIAGSSLSGNTATGEGGGIAIHSSGPVEISDSTVSDNISLDSGGGILNSGMFVTFTGLTISGNSAVGDGGGIENQGSDEFAILDTSIASNSAENGGGFANVADSTLRVSGTTFLGNRALGVGGGFLHQSDAATEIVNTTLSGNSAGLNGGGLYLDADAGLHVVNTTITRNSAPFGSGVGTPDGTDNFPIVPHVLLLFRNTIVAGNLVGTDCFGAFGSEGGNLDGGTLCNFQGPRDRANVAPGLDALADNGGPTLTHALTAASPAVGGGVEPCQANDQRGVARELNRPCDIGAYEFAGTPEAPPPDNTHPETMLDSGPSDTTESTDAMFAFSATEPGATFECSLDGAPFAACIPPIVYTGLGAGTHAFQVRAIDAAGNRDPTPASYVWTIELPPDATPPETTIDSGPPTTTESRAAAFAFSATEPGATFECSLDGVSFAACASPAEYAGLSDGAHTFAVRAIDSSGNQDPTPASYAWTVAPPPDAMPPETTIASGPDTTTTNTDATFVFSANEPGSTFQCALDGPSFNLCVSPVVYAGLSVGTHTFAVRATDPAGNPELEPASYTWTIEPPADTIPPETSLASGPASPTESSEALFTFSASESGATFECALDDEPFAPCASPATYSGLSVSDHTFAVRAIDLAGNIDPTPESYIWTIEAPPPATTPLEVSIDTAPFDPTESIEALFTFSATQPGAIFACSLDEAAFAACVSPVVYSGLAVGSHTFAVRATGPSGNSDSATYTWTIEAPPACGAPVTLVADADAWIDQNSSSTNKGDDSILKVQSKHPSDNFRALVRFALPAGVPAGCVVQSATLRLYFASSAADRKLEALRIANSWAEDEVTWNNQPRTTGPAATTTTADKGYREWNVVTQVREIYDTGANYGFLIRDAIEGDVGFEQQLHSREKGETPPQLVIVFAPAGS